MIRALGTIVVVMLAWPAMGDDLLGGTTITPIIPSIQHFAEHPSTVAGPPRPIQLCLDHINGTKDRGGGELATDYDAGYQECAPLVKRYHAECDEALRQAQVDREATERKVINDALKAAGLPLLREKP